ncbi:MAG: family 20 glycosylhydrolase, partial [Thermoguttaceae bacterium]|nr:family 20 glycosylhydrolase [Thermoguttaceae bacterium]
ERAAQNAEFAQIAEAVAPNADFFKTPNASKIFAVADVAVAADASPAEIAEKRETSAGTLVIAASDAAGIRDSLKTLFQLAEPFGDTLKTSRFLVPETKIEDRPALGFRGIHLCWFPETNAARIEQAIRIAAFYKFNYAVIEFWGTFPFEKHPELYWDEFHTTKEEVVKLVKLGKELGIELIPQLNIFGHATAARVSVGKHVVLDRYPEFAPLFEPDGWTWRVSNPEARALLTECVLELYETFDKPRYFHLGCDEAYSAATGFEARRGGPYVDALADWLVWFRDVLAERNCRVMMWHDMLIDSAKFRGYTAMGTAKTSGLLERLPKDVVICDWQYSAPKKDETWPTTTFFQEEKGFDVLVCPWRDTAGIRSLATKSAETNGMGVLCTTWHHFYGGDMRNILIYGAQAAWGTRYRGGNLGVEFNRHLKQASEPIKDKKYVVHGVNDWQVIPETNGPQG